MTEQTTDVLITVPELAGLLAVTGTGPAGGPAAGPTAGPGPTLLDVRWRLGGPPGRELYAAGHLPGAAFVDLDRDLAAAPGAAGRHPLPAAADFERAMRRAGVSDGVPVVVYDDADSTAAARAWWLLRYFGHQSVRVLDGGFRAWTAAALPVESAAPLDSGGPIASTGGPGESGSAVQSGGPVESGGPVQSGGPAESGGATRRGAAGDFTARPGHLGLLDADGAADLARAGLLLDARAGERYRGEAEHVDPVAGHIPGAVSAPTAENVNPDGTFRPAADLAARFAALGAAAGRPVGAYCGSGVTAAHEVLALTRAGIQAALYVGSWSNWITDPTRPVATGPSPE